MSAPAIATSEAPPAPVLAAPPAPPASVTLPGIRKAAILLISLGEKASAEVIRELPDEDIQKVSTEIAAIGSVSPEQAEHVLEEFRRMKMAGDFFAQGGPDYATRMLSNAFGNEAAKKLLDQICRLGPDMNIGVLQKADPQQLISVIRDEHPQTIAVIISQLPPSQAGAALMALADNLRSEVIVRIAALDRISPEVFRRIADTVGRKLKTTGEVSRSGGARAVADILNRLEAEVAEQVLTALAESDPRVEQAVRNLMFVFEDILMISKESMKALVAKVDRKVLTIALKGTSDQLKTHFTQCMSQRGAEMLREDMDALGPIRVKEVEAAQREIIALVRQLLQDGTLSLKGTVADRYVV